MTPPPRPVTAASPTASVDGDAPRERRTRQRSAIRQALVDAQRPLLPHEVLGAAQAQVPGLGLATVYRNLKGLVDDGEVCAVNLPGAHPRFEISRHHHHHFQCRRCERVFDIDGCPGDLAPLAPPGFSVEHHDLTLYGQCADCRGPAATPPRAARAAADTGRPPPAGGRPAVGRSGHRTGGAAGAAADALC